MIYGDGLLTSNPCPPELFALIIRINHLRSVLKATPVPADSFMPSVTELLNQVTSFSPDIWAAKTAASQAISSSSSRIEELDAVPEPAQPGGAARYAQSREFLNWRRMATVYKSSTALYCILSLIGSETSMPGSASKADPLELKALFQRTLSQNLKELCIARETRSDQMRRLVMWPLAIAGTQLEKGHDQMKDLVRRELDWQSVELGTSTPLVIREFLERLWTRGPETDPEMHRTAWDAMFDKPYAFAV
jgi:transcription factor-like protein